MHWVINTNLKREGGYDALIYNLDRQEVPYTMCRKPPFADYLIALEDDLDEDGNHKPIMLDHIEGPVFVAGTTSMKAVSEKHGWTPGYLDSPGIKECLSHWGEHMLNHDAIFDTIENINIPFTDFFIRPDEDSKAFAGTVMNDIDFFDWRKDILDIKGWTSLPRDALVMACSLKKIWAEYRCSVVDGRVVTASRYKTGNTVAYSQDVDDRIINYANDRVKEWNPRIAFTLDVADTPEGLKIIETNAISSSGFYALDMGIFVHEINKLGERDDYN